MAESGLSIGLPDLRVEVAFYLGYGRDSTKWSAGQITELDAYIQSGIRNFYYPPASDIVDPTFEWSFLRPTTTIVTVASTWEYALPDNFGRIVDKLYFEASASSAPIPIVSYGLILANRSRSESSGRPQLAATRWKETDGASGQRQEIVFSPTPDAAYTLTYRYEAFNGSLTVAKPYPLGGMKHAETIISSCLAVAEQKANGERGTHSATFERHLSTSVMRDKASGAKVFGYMGDPGDAHSLTPRHMFGESYGITYKGDSI